MRRIKELIFSETILDINNISPFRLSLYHTQYRESVVITTNKATKKGNLYSCSCLLGRNNIQWCGRTPQFQ